MRKFAVGLALALACALILPAAALNVNQVTSEWPIQVPSGTATVVTSATVASESRNVPRGLMLFTGDGTAFYVRFKADFGDGTVKYSEYPQLIPGAMTLPLPTAYRSGDSLFIDAEIYCETDSVHGYWVK